jgi:hypothetical protein
MGALDDRVYDLLWTSAGRRLRVQGRRHTPTPLALEHTGDSSCSSPHRQQRLCAALPEADHGHPRRGQTPESMEHRHLSFLALDLPLLDHPAQRAL